MPEAKGEADLSAFPLGGSHVQPLLPRHLKCIVRDCPAGRKDGFEECHGHHDAIAAEVQAGDHARFNESAAYVFKFLLNDENVSGESRELVTEWLRKFYAWEV